MANDPVFAVQEAAYRQLLARGEEAQPPVKRQGELIKDTGKVLVRIKKSLPKDHTFEEFKEKLKRMRSDLYNTYEGSKGDQFDAWLQEAWQSASTR